MSAEPDVLPSDEQPPKKMRKGTHSCAECRRRKKSCIPHPSASNVCTECFARGVQCREQQPDSVPKRPAPDSKQNLQQRVAELEAALQNVVAKLGAPSTKNDGIDNAVKLPPQVQPSKLPPTPAASSSVPSPETRLENAPVLSLFDNSILSRLQDDQVCEPTEGATPASPENDGPSAKMDSIRHTLLSLFPEQTRLNNLLTVSQAWWTASRTMFPGIYGPMGDNIKLFVKESKTSRSVQQITKALLCISISLQEAPPSASIDIGPHFSDADAKSHVMDVLHNLVMSDDDIIGTIDGIECLFLHAKHDTNEGRLRRAWITMRRGLSLAQLIGLQNRPRVPSREDPSRLRAQSIWKALYQGDRYLSLLLGLPYAVSELHCKIDDPPITNPDGHPRHLTSEEYIFKLSNLIGHIIDRNQEPPSSNTLPVTVKIEGEMTDLAASMPAEWWSTAIPAADVPSQMYSHLLPQIWHHLTRTLLHLPFMLRAATDRRFEYNRIAALESSREMINRYRLFRPAVGFDSAVCKVVDFQVFTAAMVLVLNLLSTSPHDTTPLTNTNPSSNSHFDPHQESISDERLITETHDLLHRASEESGGGVTLQAARALRIFTKEKSEPCPYGQTTASVVIPYFGTVVFQPGKSFANMAYLKKCEAASSSTAEQQYQQKAQQQPMQLPTPGTDTMDTAFLAPNHPSSISASASTSSSLGFAGPLASIPDDLNFGGYQQLQQPQGWGLDGGAGVGGDVFANINLDLDQDWSWFWDHTNVG